MVAPYELKITRYRPSGPSARTSACFTVAAADHFSMDQTELFHVISTRHSILVASPDEAPCQASFLQICFCLLFCSFVEIFVLWPLIGVLKFVMGGTRFFRSFQFRKYSGRMRGLSLLSTFFAVVLCVFGLFVMSPATGQTASLTNLTVMPGTRNLTVSWTAVSGIAAYAADITSTPKTGLARSGPLCECKFRHTPVGSAGSSGRC